MASVTIAKSVIHCKSSLQQGILQPIIYGIAGALCIAATLIIYHYSVKYNIFQNSTIALVLGIIGLSVICSSIMFVLLTALPRINFSWRVTLPRAIEFTAAMHKLGLFDFDTQIAFIAAQNIRIFITDKPLLHDTYENVIAKRYLPLSLKDVLSSHKGRSTLCLDAEEYERLAHNARTPLSVHESAVLLEKNAELTALRDELLRKTTALETMTIDYTALEKKFDELKNSDGTAPGRSKRIENLHVSRAPFWLAAVALIRRLHKEATADIKYTKAIIQAEFEREIEDYPT